MKAILIEKFVKNNSELTVKTIPTPVPVGPDEVLVSITHAAIQHVDLLYARGLHQNNRSGLVAPPFVLGLEYAGVVASVASNPNSKYRVGDRVFGGGVGAFAEQIVTSESALGRVPARWTLREAAGVGQSAAVSYGAIVKCGGLRAGETVLVHAAGGNLGVMAVQIARGIGAKVIATVGSDEKADIVRKLGAEGVVRYDLEGWEKQVLDLTAGVGVDVVYDTVGLVQKSIRCTKFGGRIVIAGFAGLGGKMELLAMNRVLLKNIQLLGYRYGESGRRDPAGNAAIVKAVAEMIDQDLIKPVIYEERFHGLESLPGALDALAARKVWGKAVIDIQDVVDQAKSRL